MAATIEEIQNKVSIYYNSNKIKKFHTINSYIQRYLNYTPFSVRKTATTLEQIFNKLFNGMKGAHNKKYLQSFFPYYVFYEKILDLDGNIVLLVCKESISQNRFASRNVLHVKRDFYNKYSDYINHILLNKIGGNHQNEDYRAIKVIHGDIDDLYFLFHKEYVFSNISERKNFKDELLSKISEEILKNKEFYLSNSKEPQVLPF